MAKKTNKLKKTPPKQSDLKMDRESKQTFFQRRHGDGQQTQEKMFSITNYQGNAQLLEWLIKMRRNSKSWLDVKKREPSHTVIGSINWCHHCGKQYGVSSKN